MIRPIVPYGNDELRKVCKPLTKKSIEKLPATLIDDMWDTMYNASGVGLAAPQIGLSIQLFIIDSKPLTNSKKNIKCVFINPCITHESETTDGYKEGCLSIPGISEEVDRPTTIRLSYYNEKFEKQENAYEGIDARIIQHEYDHLHGKLFIDYLSALNKQLIKKKLANIAKGICKTNYPLL